MTTYRFAEPRPWNHQVKAMRKTLGNKGVAALFVEMRLGKSRIAVDVANALALQGKVQRVLVFCPLSSMGIWRREIKKFTPTEHEPIEWNVVNFERVYDRLSISEDGQRGWIPVDNKELEDFDADMIVVDESHIVSNSNSVTHRKVYKIAKRCRYRLLLTGTPGAPEKLFAQFRILDEALFGSSMRDFQARYCKMGGYMGKQVKGYRNEDKLQKRIAPYVFQCREEDAWEVPKVREQIVPVRLMESFPIYDQMLNDAVAMVSGKAVAAPIVLTQLLRLSQITSGHLPLTSLTRGSKPRRVGREKERVYKSLVEQLQNNKHHKLVTFCRFLPDIAVTARACMSLGLDVYPFYGAVKPDDRDRRIAAFEENDRPCAFIAQISTGSMSLDLSTAADAIYYSLDYSLTHWNQSKARIRGSRQKKKRITYWILTADGTVDEIAYLALKHKQNVVDLVLRHPAFLRNTRGAK